MKTSKSLRVYYYYPLATFTRKLTYSLGKLRNVRYQAMPKQFEFFFPTNEPTSRKCMNFTTSITTLPSSLVTNLPWPPGLDTNEAAKPWSIPRLISSPSVYVILHRQAVPFRDQIKHTSGVHPIIQTDTIHFHSSPYIRTHARMSVYISFNFSSSPPSIRHSRLHMNVEILWPKQTHTHTVHYAYVLGFSIPFHPIIQHA